MNKAIILNQIKRMEEKLEETRSAFPRGVERDVMKLVIPMMEDQLALMRSILELVEDTDG